MEGGFENIVYILALTKERNITSLSNWCPFLEGDSLGKIISEHNSRCMNCYKKWGWEEQDIKKWGQGVQIYYYDPSNLDNLDENCFSNVDILLIDIDTLFGEDKENETLGNMKIRLAKTNKKYNLLQISQKNDAISKSRLFKQLAIIPSNPEVFTSQKEMEDYLNLYCAFYAYPAQKLKKQMEFFNSLNLVSMGIPSLTYQGEPRLTSFEKGNTDVIKISSQVRDIALSKGLTKNCTGELETLTYKTIIEQMAIDNIVELVKNDFASLKIDVPSPIKDIKVDPIRLVDKKDIKSSFEEPHIKPFDMLVLSLAQPEKKLTEKEESLVSLLGLEGKNKVAIYFDEPTVRSKIEHLEGIVSASKFSANLPYWD